MSKRNRLQLWTEIFSIIFLPPNFLRSAGLITKQTQRAAKGAGTVSGEAASCVSLLPYEVKNFIKTPSLSPSKPLRLLCAWDSVIFGAGASASLCKQQNWMYLHNSTVSSFLGHLKSPLSTPPSCHIGIPGVAPSL